MQSHEGTRNCPTRMDGVPALLSHRVTVPQCAERQRQHYHKCYTCRFNHARVAELGLPAENAAGASSEGDETEAGPEARMRREAILE